MRERDPMVTDPGCRSALEGRAPLAEHVGMGEPALAFRHDRVAGEAVPGRLPAAIAGDKCRHGRPDRDGDRPHPDRVTERMLQITGGVVRAFTSRQLR
jgi:hypothetical protein